VCDGGWERDCYWCHSSTATAIRYLFRLIEQHGVVYFQNEAYTGMFALRDVHYIAINDTVSNEDASYYTPTINDAIPFLALKCDLTPKAL
jgi:hypothetical protein